MILSESIKKTVQELKNFSENPILESRIFHKKLLKINDSNLILQENKQLDELQENKLQSWIARRKKQEPIAYIIGEKEFFSEEFYVNKNVLIPRPETEELIEWVLQNFEKINSYNILDLCCGSGCIGIIIAKNFPFSNIDFSDVDKECLKICKINIDKIIQQKIERFHLYTSNLFENLDTHKKNNFYDVIISNPPYVLKEEKEFISSETFLFEPHSSLFFENDQFFEKLFTQSLLALKEDGLLYLETNPNLILQQEIQLKKLGFRYVEIKNDYSGKARFLKAKK